MGIGPQKPEGGSLSHGVLILALGALSGWAYAACFHAPPPELGP